MKVSCLIIFGIFCLFNADFSNSSPSPQSYDDYYGGDTAADYSNYPSESYDEEYPSYDENGSYYDYDTGKGDCPPVCKRPKSPRCAKRRAACQKKPGNGTNSSPNGGDCPPVCKRPGSAPCKRRQDACQNKNPGNPGKPGAKGGDCPPVCKRPGSAPCKRRQDKCGNNNNTPVIKNPTCPPKCKCSGKTFIGPLELPFGHCQTKEPGSKKFFCYVDGNSPCSDKKKSGRQQNLFYSNEACDFERACGVIAADEPEEYVDFDEDYEDYSYDAYDNSYEPYDNSYDSYDKSYDIYDY